MSGKTTILRSEPLTPPHTWGLVPPPLIRSKERKKPSAIASDIGSEFFYLYASLFDRGIGWPVSNNVTWNTSVSMTLVVSTVCFDGQRLFTTLVFQTLSSAPAAVLEQ